MGHGICHVSAAPLRATPNDSSEMVSQLLFGDIYEVLGRSPNGKWVQVSMGYDGYRGWLDVQQGRPVDKEEYKVMALQKTYSASFLSSIRTKNSVRQLSIGSKLPYWQGDHLRLAGDTLEFGGEVAEAFKRLPGTELCQIAQRYIGVPYLWGGRSAFGIDCSGLAQQVMMLGGIWLPRDASQQVKEGSAVKGLIDCAPGDLAFFTNERGLTVHVGMVLENNGIIHAHGEVRMDLLDNKGIYRQEEKRYSHQLSEIRRM